MANKKITDLMSGTPVRDSLLESAIDISGTMDSRKVKAGAVADLASANVAAPYDTTVTYAIGQYCLYEGDIYRCIAITTGAFDSTKWTQIVVTGEFRRVVELTSAQYAQLTPAEQNNGTIYVKTDEETTAADIPYSAGVSVADMFDVENLLNDVNGITITRQGNTYCVCLRNATVANVITTLSSYATDKYFRAVLWDYTKTNVAVLNMYNRAVSVIDASSWSLLPNNSTDILHGGFTFLLD